VPERLEKKPNSFASSGFSGIKKEVFIMEKIPISAKGRHKSLSPEKLEAARFLYFEERLPLRKVADALGVSHMAVWRSVYSTS